MQRLNRTSRGAHMHSRRTSSITSTFDRLRIARAMHSSCFSLQRCQPTSPLSRSAIGTYPVEKLSPPSDTGESRSRNTFVLTSSGSDAAASVEGIRCTRRSASNLRASHGQRCGPLKDLGGPTISASSYSSNTSNVDRTVPLRIVGSSAKIYKRYSEAGRVW